MPGCECNTLAGDQNRCLPRLQDGLSHTCPPESTPLLQSMLVPLSRSCLQGPCRLRLESCRKMEHPHGVLTVAVPFCQGVVPRPACPAGSTHAGDRKIRSGDPVPQKGSGGLQTRTCGSPHSLNLLVMEFGFGRRPVQVCDRFRKRSESAPHTPSNGPLSLSQAEVPAHHPQTKLKCTAKQSPACLA